MEYASVPTFTTSESKARNDFNTFLGGAVGTGSVEIRHIRVRTRQPSTEAFSRKAVSAITKLAPRTKLKISVVKSRLQNGTDSKTGYATGPSGLGEAAALVMGASHPDIARYLGNPKPRATGQVTDAGHGLSPVDLFSMLHAYSHYEIANRQATAAGFGAGAMSIAAGLGRFKDASQEVMAAMDSVLAQSVCDVHAISLIAAFDGNEAALLALKDVMDVRDSGGDFGKYSLAPLSHDTHAAMELLRLQLEHKTDFSSMTRNNLWENSNWVAGEGAAAWMQKNGVDFKAASNLIHGVSEVSRMVEASTEMSRMSNSARQTMRPS